MGDRDLCKFCGGVGEVWQLRDWIGAVGHREQLVICPQCQGSGYSSFIRLHADAAAATLSKAGMQAAIDAIEKREKGSAGT